jgi:hypothetical protein
MSLTVSAVLAACDPDPGPGTSPMDPAVELGYHAGLEYAALLDGGSCPVVWGTQGGYWTMPTVRTQGIANIAQIECSLTVETGERVGYIKTKAKFFPAGETALEQRQFPIPVYHAAPNEDAPVTDLYGLQGRLGCKVSDTQGRGSELERAVVVTDR